LDQTASRYAVARRRKNDLIAGAVSVILLQRKDTEAPLRARGKAVCSEAYLRKEAFHDIASTTHDRGHAGEELLTKYPKLLLMMLLNSVTKVLLSLG